MSRLNVLIVEDEYLIGLSIRKRLERIGLHVILIVPSGDEAYQISAEKVPDLILMDIRLEGDLNGLETARTIWENFSVPIILVSGNLEFQASDSFREDWCYGVVSKPLVELELETVVSKAIHRIFQEKYNGSSREFLQVYNPMEVWLRNQKEIPFTPDLEYPEDFLDSSDRFLAIDTFYLFSNREKQKDSHTELLDVKDYLTYLAFLIWNRYNPNNSKHIHMNLDSESVFLREEQAIQVGVILAESLKNSIQYAFSHSCNGNRLKNWIEIKFGVSRSKGKFYLKIRDNGIGIYKEGISYPEPPQNVHIKLGQGLGLKIIRGMTELLGSEFYLTGDQGTCIEVLFPIDSYSAIR